MKKVIILSLFMIFISSEVFSETKSYQSYTPFTPEQYHAYNDPYYNPYYDNFKKRERIRQNYYKNHPYYYDNGYYNPQKRTIQRKINDFFSSGKITGYTPSFNDSFNTPYAYQQGWEDSNGNYYYNNYNQQNGMTVKLMD